MAQIIFGDLQSKLYRPKIDEEARYPYLHDKKNIKRPANTKKRGQVQLTNLTVDTEFLLKDLLCLKLIRNVMNFEPRKKRLIYILSSTL